MNLFRIILVAVIAVVISFMIIFTLNDGNVSKIISLEHPFSVKDSSVTIEPQRALFEAVIENSGDTPLVVKGYGFLDRDGVPSADCLFVSGIKEISVPPRDSFIVRVQCVRDPIDFDFFIVNVPQGASQPQLTGEQGVTIPSLLDLNSWISSYVNPPNNNNNNNNGGTGAGGSSGSSGGSGSGGTTGPVGQGPIFSIIQPNMGSFPSSINGVAIRGIVSGASSCSAGVYSLPNAELNPYNPLPISLATGSFIFTAPLKEGDNYLVILCLDFLYNFARYDSGNYFRSPPLVGSGSSASGVDTPSSGGGGGSGDTADTVSDGDGDGAGAGAGDVVGEVVRDFDSEKNWMSSIINWFKNLF